MPTRESFTTTVRRSNTNTQKRRRRRQKKTTQQNKKVAPKQQNRLQPRTPRIVDPKVKLSNVVKEVQRQHGAEPTVNIKSTPLQTVTQWDVNTPFLMIEAICAHYAMTSDLFKTITPQQLVYYLWYVLVAHFNDLGILSNSQGYPLNTRHYKLSVPYAWAKFLEYMSPYSKQGVSYAFRWVVTSPFPTTAPTYTSIGCLAPFYPRATWYPSHQIAPMLVAAADGIQDAPQILDFVNNGNGSMTFNAFANDEPLIALVSSALSRRGSVIPVSKIPQSAPDSSAYSRLTVPIEQGTCIGSCESIDYNYDPELTMLFAPTQTANGSFSNTTSKSYPRPLFNFDTILCPDSYQIASTWVWVAQNYPRPYRAGKFKDVFTVFGHNLKTLYPTIQPVSGIPLGEAIVAQHRQVIAAKSTQLPADEVDPFSTNLCYELTVAYAAQQLRMNMTEVIHLQCPPVFQNGNQQVYMPQFLYCDSSWNGVQTVLPSAVISSLGVIVVDGVLRIPFNEYTAQAIGPVTVPIGPQIWSSIGFDFANDTEQSATLSVVPIGIRNDADPPLGAGPSMVWDDSKRPALIANASYVSSWYGAQNPVDGIPNSIYPCYPTSGVASCIQNKYKKWLQSNTFAQSVPIAPVNKKLEGDLTAMSQALTFDDGDTSLTQPQNNTDAVDQVNYNAMTTSPTNVTTPMPVSAKDAAFGAIAGHGNNDFVASDPAIRTRYRTVFNALLSNTGLVGVPASIPVYGPHSTNIPWSTGKSGLMDTIAQQVGSTQSPLSSQISRAQNSPNYDIVKLFKNYIGSTLEQSMAAVPTRQVPVRKFVSQSTPVTKKKRGKVIDFLADKAEGVGKDLFNLGFDTLKGQVKQIPKKLEETLIDLF